MPPLNPKRDSEFSVDKIRETQRQMLRLVARDIVKRLKQKQESDSQPKATLNKQQENQR